ncbi:MAG: hypothetical protein J1G38_07715 [Clostridiales bacterium]|nr:hypothetical protein [Clostridiales bacterium]
MDKYSGCNIVESVVTRMTPVKVKKKRSFLGAIVRLTAAAAIVGVICFIAYAPFPWLKSAREGAKRVFCYDVFGREDFGTSPVISRLFGE